jgi:hypothetical protein
MRKMVLLLFVAMLLPHEATADVVRHGSIPKAYRGAWAPGTADCKADKSLIVLAAKRYVSSAAKCTVEYVSEVPGGNGAIYSARLRCSDRAGPPGKLTAANLIMRSDAGGGISAGPGFESLTAYQRCSAPGRGASR